MKLLPLFLIKHVRINNVFAVKQRDINMTSNRKLNTGGGNYNENIEVNYIQDNYYATENNSKM